MTITGLKFAAAVLLAVSTGISYAGAGHQHAAETGVHNMAAMDSSGGGHMDHMNEVLQWLKHELGAKYEQPVPPATKQQMVSGQKIFTKFCVTCHGASGKGDGVAAAGFKQKPADFTDAEHSKFYSDQGRLYLIKKGSKGTPMPAWEDILKEDEILSVHAFIRSLRSPVKTINKGHTGHTH